MKVFIDSDLEEQYGEQLYQEHLEKENKRLHSIINEVREYIGMCSSDDEAIICIESILEKVEEK